MTRTSATAIVTLALAAAGVGACGSDDAEQSAPPPPPAQQTTTGGGTGATSAQVVPVAADPDGKLAFVQSALQAEAGGVTFDFANESPVPHDFNIEQDGKKIAGTEVISNGSESVTTDLAPGTYQFYCSVGGHRQAGMEGTLTVK